MSRTCCGSVFRSSSGRFGSSALTTAVIVDANCAGSPRRADVDTHRIQRRSSWRYGWKNSGGILLLHLAVLRVLRPRRRSAMSSLLPSPVRPHHLADGVAPEVELLRERLVDDRDLLAPRSVGVGELAPGHQRHAERSEIAGADLVEARVVVGVGPGLEALHRDGRCPSCCPRAAAPARP